MGNVQMRSSRLLIQHARLLSIDLFPASTSGSAYVSQDHCRTLRAARRQRNAPYLSLYTRSFLSAMSAQGKLRSKSCGDNVT